MRKTLMIVSALALLTGSGNAAESKPATDSGSYCFTGWVTLSATAPEALSQTLVGLYENCKPGDTIAVPKGPLEEVVIGRVCDFNKSITVTSRSIMCAMSALRPGKGMK